ncbi:MAG: 2-isopropylmalate synthase [Deltaproteobacteria bacterium]|nr:2-isopropylmalate synthase [Deltaproteobacteria bacterium]
MHKHPAQKYIKTPPVVMSDRRWPSQELTQAPIWCSVDLRDGNQALIAPMNLEKKLEMFKLLLAIGFKEIEVGFPSASETEYSFLRYLIEKKLVPGDVKVQVLTQSREHLIQKTFESLRGAKQAIVHLYNSTSTLQRKVVFRLEKQEIIKIGVDGARLIKNLAEQAPDTKFTFEYSPESFSGTELDFAVEICDAIVDVWQPTVDNRVIINLPATVEMATPNIYADQIEWFCSHVKNRDKILISLHAHNDRGCAVAATELALLAGADRVEGTLFGNGERTGNVDLVTVALNLYSQGIHPGLDFSDLPRIAEVCERLTSIPTHTRAPYAGELVFTAFSGSHQDAINKGMLYTSSSATDKWEVPYLPIDPKDIGRSYEGIVRINSQSGKGGVAYVMRSEHGFNLPKRMHAEFARVVQAKADAIGKELRPEEIWETFHAEYVFVNNPLDLLNFETDKSISSHHVQCCFQLNKDGAACQFYGQGNGPIDALKEAIAREMNINFNVEDYSQHSLGGGADAEAVSYIAIKVASGQVVYGVGIDSNITLSGLKALISAVNRLLRLS